MTTACHSRGNGEQTTIFSAGREGGSFVAGMLLTQGIRNGWAVTTLESVRQRSHGGNSFKSRFKGQIQFKARWEEAEFDYVVNCAGLVDHSGFGSGGEDVFDVHFLGLVNLLSVLDRKNVKGFVNIGSSEEWR